MSSNKNEQCYNDFVSKIIIVIEGKKVHLSSESTSLADFGVHISQLNLIDKEGNHMISQIQQPITELLELQRENAELRKQVLELQRENAELRKQVITLQNVCDKYFNLYGPLPAKCFFLIIF
jgi:uncharacterized protein YhaN